MHRRALLAGLGTGLFGLAGCLADRPDDGGAGTDETPTPGPATTGPAGTPQTGGSTPGTVTTTPTVAPPGTPPHDAPFPPGRDDVADLVWYRDVSDPGGRLHLAPSRGTVALPGEVSFTLSNPTDRRFMTNFYDWALYRWESGRWHRVAPTAVPEPLMAVDPGGEHTWRVTFERGDLGSPQFHVQGTETVTVSPVGGGHYAFAVDGWWEDQTATPTYEHETVCAARVALDGDQLALVPSDAVTATSREGDTVVVAADNPTSDGTPATYVLTRDEDAPDPRTVITEQVYRQWPLRDALAHAGDASEVRVETTTGVTPLFGVQEAEDPAVTYDGRTYRISAEERDQ